VSKRSALVSSALTWSASIARLRLPAYASICLLSCAASPAKLMISARQRDSCTGRVRRDLSLRDLCVAHNTTQQIVEIVGHAASHDRQAL
jgi:hypothetical protein